MGRAATSRSHRRRRRFHEDATSCAPARTRRSRTEGSRSRTAGARCTPGANSPGSCRATAPGSSSEPAPQTLRAPSWALPARPGCRPPPQRRALTVEGGGPPQAAGLPPRPRRTRRPRLPRAGQGHCQERQAPGPHPRRRRWSRHGRRGQASRLGRASPRRRRVSPRCLLPFGSSAACSRLALPKWGLLPSPRHLLCLMWFCFQTSLRRHQPLPAVG
mmetsp:Transcript_6636/g.17820  ORF Transcript_6636/g.17820 Transcript_6636/m.17820 type:complete len:217 (-) Transcript_6636:346-996(-)